MTERAFIVGNGKSLENFDYDRLKGEITFAVGRINLIYGRFSWRPSNYVIMDRFASKNWVEECKTHFEQDYPCWVTTDMLASMRPWWAEQFGDKITPVMQCHSDIQTFPSDNWHPPHYCTFGGSIPVALQIAMFEFQYSPIYVLGCDGYHSGRDSHMVPGYLAGSRTYQRQQAFRVNATLNQAHGFASSAARRLGLEIFNTNPDTMVAQAYPIVDLDEILST